MRIALFGARGTIGRRIAGEALERGHDVTAVSRDPETLDLDGERWSAAGADVLDPDDVRRVAEGHDAVVSAVGPGLGEGTQPTEMLVEAARALLEGVTRAGVGRLVVVGGAGSLEVEPGVQLVDTPDFPEEWKELALAHRDALDVYRSEAPEELAWTCISPPALITPGERTGRYRTGRDRLLTNADGESAITAEDFAVALLDELEEPGNPRRRMTVGY